MIRTWSYENCKFCNKTGIQTNKDGLKVKCPECNGTGLKIISNYDNLPPDTYCLDK